MARTQAGIDHATMWTKMRNDLIQQIHQSHFDTFLRFLKVEPCGEDFVEQKRNLMDCLEERHSSKGCILELLIDLATKIQMNLTLNGCSVSLKKYLMDFQSGWMQARDEARAEGHLDEGEFVGRENAVDAVRKILRKDTRTISGVFICGMYGCGKTTLASEVTKKGLNKLFDRCFIDLKGIKTTDDLFYKLKQKLGMKTVGQKGVNWSQITDRLCANNKDDRPQDPLIILDGVEQLLEPERREQDLDEGFCEAPSTCEEMIRVLAEITEIPNSRVKLILTSQLDIWADGIDKRYPSSVYDDLKTLRRALEIYRLENFNWEECRMLIRKVAPKASKGVNESQFRKIANACGFNALGVQLVANYLRTIEGSVEKGLANITAIAEEAHKFDRGGEQKLKRVFDLIFNSLAENSRKLLIQLSAFDAPFDEEAAIMVAGSESADSEVLDVLVQRHLLEATDSGDAFREHTNIRFSLHTLTHQYIAGICEHDGNYAAIRSQAEKNKQAYYRYLICELGRQMVNDSLAASLTLSEYRGQLKECINRTIIDETVLPSFADRENFKKQYRSHVAMEWFLKPKKRKAYYLKKAQLAKRKGDMVAFVGMYSWYVDTFFDVASYDSIEVKEVLEEIKKALDDQDHFPPNEKDEGRALVRGHYFYIQARYHWEENMIENAIEMSRKSLTTFQDVCGDDLATARALNLVGSAYHKGNQPEDSLKYHKEACSVLEALAEKYSTDIYFDSVMFYQNVGSQYHTIGNKIADKMGSPVNIISSTRREILEKEKLENYDMALDYYGKGIDVIYSLHMKNTWNHALILRNRSTLLSELGEIKQALESAKDALHIAEMYLAKDILVQTKSNSILATTYCGMAEQAFEKGDIDTFDQQMLKVGECFHSAAKHAIQMGGTDENQPVLENLMRNYRRHLYKLGKYQEAHQVTTVFETLLGNISPHLYQRMKKRVARLLWLDTEVLRRPLVDDLPTPYLEKFRGEEGSGSGEELGRPVHVSWRDSGKRCWRRFMFEFEPLHRIWYHGCSALHLCWYIFSPWNRGQGQTAAGQIAIKRKQGSERRSKKKGERSTTEGVNPDHVSVPADSKLAKVFEESDSDPS